MDEAAALPIAWGYVVHQAVSGTMAASDALPAHCPLPGSSPVIGQCFSGGFPQTARPGRTSPVPAIAFRTFRALYAGRFFGAAFQVLHPFRGLHPETRGSAPPLPRLRGGQNNDAAGFASCYGPLGRSPKWAFDAGLRPGLFLDQAASLLPGILVFTRTGLAPAGDDELSGRTFIISVNCR